MLSLRLIGGGADVCDRIPPQSTFDHLSHGYSTTHLETTLSVADFLHGKDPDTTVEAVHQDGAKQGSRGDALFLWRKNYDVEIIPDKQHN
jgi:hypothetical protein